jgi:hypothetical protein
MERPPYQVGPENAELTLSLDEVESLEMNRGKSLKDARTAAHFVHRVLLTMREYINAVQRLTYELESVQARSRNRAGVATTLNPMDAAQYLTSEQRAELFDATMRSTYDRANRARQEAETEASEARKLHGRMRLILTRILEDPRLDPATRQRLHQELQRLEAAEPTSTPTLPPQPSPSNGETLGDIFGGV